MSAIKDKAVKAIPMNKTAVLIEQFLMENVFIGLSDIVTS